MIPKKILDFKTISPFFEMCRDGEKPFDIRKIDNADARFRALFQIRGKENPQWAIRFTNPATGEVYMKWLLAWNYLMDHNQFCVYPSWAIMYLGEPKEATNDTD